MPPVSTTSSIPRESRAKIATWDVMIRRLSTVRKFGESREKTTMISARARKARPSMSSFDRSKLFLVSPAAVEVMVDSVRGSGFRR